MFDNHLYTVLLGIVDLAVKQAIMDNDNFETEFVSQLLVSNLFCVSIFLQSLSELYSNDNCSSAYEAYCYILGWAKTE